MKYPSKIRHSLPPLKRRRPGLLRRLGDRLWRRLSSTKARPAGRHNPSRSPIGPHRQEPEVHLKIAVPKPRPHRVEAAAEAAKKFHPEPVPEPVPVPEEEAPAPVAAPVAASVAPAPVPRPAPPAPAPRPAPMAPVPMPEPPPSARRPPARRRPASRGLRPKTRTLWLVLLAVLLTGVAVYYGRYFQSPPRAKVARIPAASLPRIAPLEAGIFERHALARDQVHMTEVILAPGSNLSKALEEVGLSSRSNFRGVLDCLMTGDDPLDVVRPGAILKAFWADSGLDVMTRLEFYPAAGAPPWVVLPKSQGGFWRFSLAAQPLNVNRAGAGQVEGSLWNAGIKAGLDGGIIMNMADLLASDIDFVTGLRKGDTFEVLYSRDYLDARPQGPPVIEMLRMNNNGRSYEYYRFINSKGRAGYYSREGQSNLKTFLASPLQYARISSGFSRARVHPIYKVVRPHLGVDYAAPTGTPVSAVADGKVTAARWSGGFGRLVTIQHDATYTTMYGHLSSFAPGLKEGSMVKQGDLIGRVGASGVATGPHLDFRLRKNGVYVDPIPELARQVGRRLEGADYTAFASVIPRLEKRLADQLAAQSARPSAAVENLSLEPEMELVAPDQNLDRIL